MAVLYLRRGILLSTIYALITLLSGSGAARAQTGLAAVAGVVTDSTGSVIAGAKVVLLNAASGQTMASITGPDGRYTFPTVPPGTYSVAASAAGFAEQRISGLTLLLDQHVQENLTLSPGSRTESVSVTGEAPQVDTTAYDTGGVISQPQIDMLPIQNRQYMNLGVLVAGTSQGANRTFYNSLQAGSGVYFYANGFYLDGVTNQQIEEGDPRQNVPMGAVAEFKTYTSSTPIELGWVMGGFTTVVTKSGTNQIHGEAFEYYRDTAMTALNQFQQAAVATQGTGNPPYRRDQWGGDIGGPILRDRLHYYGAYDGTEQTSSYTMYVPPIVAADYAAPGLLGTFPAPYHDRLATGRADYTPSPTQQMFVRWAQEWNLVTRNGCGSPSTIGCYDGQIPRWAYVAGHTWEPNPHMVNDARFQYAYIAYELGPWDTPIPTKPGDLVNPSYTRNVSVAYSFPSFGWGHTYAAVGIESRYELNDTLNLLHGGHQFKMGGDASYVPYVDAAAITLNGEWVFKTDQVFNPADPGSLTNPYEFIQNAVPQIYYLPSNQQAYFFGDVWRARPGLTLDYGLRWERQIGATFLDHYTPSPSEPAIPFEGDPHRRGDRRNFGPRLGFTWDPFGRGDDVIRGGFGIYYNFIETELTEAEKLNFVACPITLVSTATSPLPYPDPYSGGGVTEFCNNSKPNVTILSPQLRNPYQYQFSLGYSRQLGTHLSLSVDGIYARGLRDYKIYDLNYPLLDGVPSVDGARPYSNFTQIDQLASTGSSEYKGLFVRLERRLGDRYMYSLSYTLASALDNNPHAAPVSYNTPQHDWGPAGIDQRQAIIGSASWVAPWHIIVGGILTFRSAPPFSVTSTVPTCAAPTGTQALPAACDGEVNGGVLPPSALNANGTGQFVPGTTHNQGNRGISYAAINTYRSQLTGYDLSSVSAGSVDSTNFLDLDLRLSKSVFHHDVMDLQLFGQAFNLFGRENFTAITVNPTVASFGAATNAQTLQPTSNVQIGELGAKLSF